MNPESTTKKLTMLLTTANLFFWGWALTALDKREVGFSSAQIFAGIALMLAMWIQYRSVLEVRKHEKKTA
jgi:hypothetical protein